MTTAWLVVFLIAGPMLGLLGHKTRTTQTPGSALAAGIAYGLLSGQGWQEIAAAPPWALLAAAADGEVAPGFLAAMLIQVVLSLAVLAWLAHVQRLWRAWPHTAHRNDLDRDTERAALATTPGHREPARLTTVASAEVMYGSGDRVAYQQDIGPASARAMRAWLCRFM